MPRRAARRAGQSPATASSGLRGARAAAEEDETDETVEGEEPEDGVEDALNTRIDEVGVDHREQEQEPGEADGANDARDGAAPERAYALDEGHAREDVRGHDEDAERGAVGATLMDGEAEVPDDYRAQEEQDEGCENLGEDDQASRGAAAGGGGGGRGGGHGFEWGVLDGAALAGTEPGHQDSAGTEPDRQDSAGTEPDRQDSAGTEPDRQDSGAGASAGGASPETGFLARGFLT